MNRRALGSHACFVEPVNAGSIGVLVERKSQDGGSDAEVCD